MKFPSSTYCSRNRYSSFPPSTNRNRFCSSSYVSRKSSPKSARRDFQSVPSSASRQIMPHRFADFPEDILPVRLDVRDFRPHHVRLFAVLENSPARADPVLAFHQRAGKLVPQLQREEFQQRQRGAARPARSSPRLGLRRGRFHHLCQQLPESRRAPAAWSSSGFCRRAASRSPSAGSGPADISA